MVKSVLNAQNCQNWLSWICMPNENQLSHRSGPIRHIFFLVSKTVARPTLLLLSLILHKVWASPWNTWGDFWNKNCGSITGHVRKHASGLCSRERILAWVESCELRIACVGAKKTICIFFFGGLFLHLLWWNLCVAAEGCCVGLLVVRFSSVSLYKLATVDQSLLRISIALWAWIANLRWLEITYRLVCIC